MSDVITPPLPGAPLPTLTPAQPSAQTQRATHEFEAMFLTEMLGPMFEGLQTDGLGGGGIGEEMFRPMLIEQYAQAIEKAGGIGLANALMRELTRLQAAQAQAAQPTAPSPTTQSQTTGATDGAAR